MKPIKSKKSVPIKFELLKDADASKVHGEVESLFEKNIIGWAQYKDDITQTVVLDVYDGDKYLATIQANKNTSKIGLKRNLGSCGFIFPVPEVYLSGDKHAIKFIDHKNRQSLSGSPFYLGKGIFDSEFKLKNGQFLVGFIQQRTSAKAVYSLNLLLDNQIFWQKRFRGGNYQEIKVKLPEIVFDSKSHIIQIKVTGEQGELLLMTMRKIKHRYLGNIEHITDKKVRGWLFNLDYPNIPVDIEIAFNGFKKIQTSCTISRKDVQERHQLSTDKIGFTVDLPDSLALNLSTSIEIFIKGSGHRILNKKFILTPKDIVIRSLISAAEHLNSWDLQGEHQELHLSAGINATIDANTWVRQQIIAPIIQQLRHKPGLSTNLQLSINPITQVPVIEKAETIDIIIPVYKGYDETLACINSVLAANNKISHQIIVINDQSPDGRLIYKLQAMAKENLLTLIETPKNLGFVGAVNIGLGLHKERDVVVLNSDTEVYDYWLDRLKNAADQNNNIGTVTPFSNNATICSFPEFNQDNPIIQEINPQRLNQWFAESNTHKVVDLPTAVGFCMLIKREVLETLGYLDEKTWQKGYGEENDFCLKASSLGWRHVLATDVYVQHHGSVSFAGDKQHFLEINLAKLNQRYPDYPATVQRFICQDPVAKYRNPVIKKMLQQQSKQYILFIMHNLGGGAKTNADQMATLLNQQGYAVLELVANSETQWELKDSGGKLRLKYYYPQDYQKLQDDLSDLGVWRIHFHQLIGFPKQIWELPEELSCAYDFTAHDFLPICPRINMIDENGHYCGQSQFDMGKCQRCIQMNGLPELQNIDKLWNQYQQSIKVWREEFEQRLSKAENVFYPSQSTAKIYKSHYTLKNGRVKAHPESPFIINKQAPIEYNETIINIAVIGAIGDHKGSQLLLNCAKHALKEGQPLHFVIIGFTNIDESFSKLDNVTLTGAYKGTEQLQKYIEKYRCQIALFLSVWPETFCYTLTEALQNNLYPIALNYGAIAERIKKLKFGKVLSVNLQAKSINNALIVALESVDKVATEIHYPGMQYPDIIKDYYNIESSE